MTPSDTCPKCRAPQPSSATRGLCPACLMDAAGGETEVMAVPAGFGAALELDTLRRAFPQFDILALRVRPDLIPPMRMECRRMSLSTASGR